MSTQPKPTSLPAATAPGPQAGATPSQSCKLTSQDLINTAEFPTPVAIFVIDPALKLPKTSLAKFPYNDRKDAFPYRDSKTSLSMTIEDTATSAVNNAANAYVRAALMRHHTSKRIQAMTKSQRESTKRITAMRLQGEEETKFLIQPCTRSKRRLTLVYRAASQNMLIDSAMADETA
ncbi:hypothetical protein C8Q80DRAFT_1117220 [Daedaleopsis nitida]|nr:hypothetical protein C8Q80DRAFT_1117220 [Daedaleopsis nitida]